MPRFLLLLITSLCLTTVTRAQSIVNGGFSSGAASWGCSAEVNSETTYGGSNGSNSVDEVDAAAGLCQTVSGFVIGNNYYISIDASRRTGGCPSPATTNMDVTVSGGVLFATITRTNTTFGFVTSGFLFTANSTAHTITYAAGSGFGGSTCGMIVDNILIAASTLPIELKDFYGEAADGLVNLYWHTATEKNNAGFDIEKSADGTSFETIAHLPSKAPEGNSQSQLAYSATDKAPLDGTAYYRLKQVDHDGQFSYSKLISISSRQQPAYALHPNPNSGTFYLDLAGTEINSQAAISISDQLGRIAHSSSFVYSGQPVSIVPTQPLQPGCYYCLIRVNSQLQRIKLIVT